MTETNNYLHFYLKLELTFWLTIEHCKAYISLIFSVRFYNLFLCVQLNTVKLQIESATLFKIWHFRRDSNRVRIVFEWGLYFLIYFKSSKNLTKLAVNSSKMMKNIANLIWFFYINIELTIYYVAKSCQISFFGQTKD